MYIRTWKKGKTYYAALVESNRIGKKVIQTVKCYLGEVKENQIPYLKAAYSKDKPKLIYKDGSTYEG